MHDKKARHTIGHVERERGAFEQKKTGAGLAVQETTRGGRPAGHGLT
jgi:hypothetical protein